MLVSRFSRSVLSSRRLRVVADGLVQLSQFKRPLTALWNLANHSRWLPRHDRETGYNHKRGHDRVVENLDVVLDDGELVDDAALPDGDMRSNTRRLHHRALPNKNMIPQAQRHVCKDAIVQTAGRAQNDAAGEKAVSADGDGGAAGGRGAGRGRGADEVAADHDFGLDDRLAAQHDVLRADEVGLARDLVARVLERA